MEKNRIVPEKKQLDFLDWEFGAFFHFGIRTFYEGYEDWDGKEMSADAFFPDQLDCDQWIRTVSRAGAKYAILVCKHHDGFANWPSAYTEYSVKNTPWKEGKGDVVREFTDACRKYGVKAGLYYSPADAQQTERTDEEHDDYFINQISELLTNYGKIDYLWFDGCGSEGHEYNKPRIIDAIRGMQPEILIFNMWDPDTRWIGNEVGIAPYPNFNIVSDVDFSVLTEEKEALDAAAYIPGECDCRMRESNWFYSDSDEDTVKSVDELVSMYYYSVGRGANLLINIGPDRRGLLPEKDCERLIAFGDEIRRRFANPLPVHTWKEGNSYFCEFETPRLVNHVVMAENLLTGRELNGFTIYAYGYPCHSDTLLEVYQGSTVGHKAICAFPSVTTKKLEIRFREENPELTDVACHYILQ
ncbi:MAG: alpha-L-fucosidase [Clostridiales bacterium]|nr:alpha-L-fucosidase [Clostridiales bacterium]